MSEEKDRMDPEQAEDPEDYVTRRRLKDVYDARSDLLEARSIASKESIRGNKSAAQQYYRKAVENYMIELQPLFFGFGGEDLWKKEEFGSFEVHPPNIELESKYNWTDDMYQISHEGEKVRVVGPLPDSEVLTVRGIESLFSAESPIRVSFEYKTQDRFRPNIDKASSVYLPENILDEMVFKAGTFLAEHGLDLDADKGLPEDELQL